jgi:hypothetical protein
VKLVKEGGSGALGFAFVVAACVESVGLHPAEVNLIDVASGARVFALQQRRGA